MDAADNLRHQVFHSDDPNHAAVLVNNEVWRETVAAKTGDQAQADREAAAVIGFTSAIAAFGAFFIPKAYGASIDATGTADAALWGFLIFYVSCALLTVLVYARPGGVLFEAERRRPGKPAMEGSR